MAGDRPGLLFQIAKIFDQERVALLNAKILTVGERAEDVFFVTECGTPAARRRQARSGSAKRCAKVSQTHAAEHSEDFTLSTLQSVIEALGNAAASSGRRAPSSSCAKPIEECLTALDSGSYASPSSATDAGSSTNGSSKRCCCRSASTTWSGRRGYARFYDKVQTKFARPRRRGISQRGGVRVVPRGGRAPRRVPRAQRGADAVVRQHRRLRRRRHDGRHLGHGRLLRADRQARAPLRAASASAAYSSRCRPRRRSSRTIASSARARRSSKASSSSAQRARHGRVHRPVHADLRPRDGRGSPTAACPRAPSSSPAPCRRRTARTRSTAP